MPAGTGTPGFDFPVCVAAGLLTNVYGQPAPGRFVPGRILVKFKSNVTDSQAAGVLASVQARVQTKLNQIGVHVAQLPMAGNETAYVQALQTPA